MTKHSMQGLIDSVGKGETVWRFYKLSKDDKSDARKMGLVVHDGYKPASWEFKCQNCFKWFDKNSTPSFTGTAEEYELLYCQPNYYGDADLKCPFCKEINHFCNEWNSITDNDDIRPSKTWKSSTHPSAPVVLTTSITKSSMNQ